jgi:ubiquinone/menaquinone biosynthesis C-methylase UbiE
MNSRPSEFTGEIPAFYERHLVPVIFAPYADDLATRLSLHLTGREGAAAPAVLELAAGTGAVTRRLLSVLPAEARLVATDLNPNMLAVAAAALGPDPRLAFAPADATALAYADGTFDAVFCQFGWMFFPDKRAAAAEARRVLVPQGRLCFNVWGAFADNPFGRITHEVVAAMYPDSPPQFYATPFGWHDPAEIRATLAAAGFAEPSLGWVTRPVVAASAADFARGLVRGNPIALDLAGRGADLDAVERAVALGLAAVGGAAPFRSTSRALVVTATA